MNQIVAEAQANGSDFISKAGDFVGVILSPGDNIQEALIQVRSAGIGEYVFFDTNNNGISDAGEGINGVTLNLLADIDGDTIFEVVATTVTGDNLATTDVVETGYYSFGPLLAGAVGGPGITYKVVVDTSTLPFGYANTVDPDGGNDSISTETLTAGEVNLEQQFGYQALDYGDAPDSYGTTIASNGARHLISIGQTEASAMLRLGFSVDSESDGQPGATALGDDNAAILGADDEDGIFIDPVTAGENFMVFALVEKAFSVDGRLNGWIDFNADGDFTDPGEQIITNAQVINGGNAFLVAAPTDAVAGDTYARFRLSSDQAAQNPTGLSRDGEVEDYKLSVSGPQFASLGNFVFEDLNANGVQDANEPGVNGVIINLYQDSNGDGTPDTLVASQISGDDPESPSVEQGFYRFSELTPGVAHQLEFIKPAGFSSFSPPDVGNDAADSDADPITGLSPVVVLAPNEEDQSIDAGLLRPASIGDSVWRDLNGNGVSEHGEPGVGNVTVLLSGTDVFGASVNRSTATDSSGKYQFNDGLLLPGTYRLSFTNLPPDLAFTVPDQGNDDADSDVDPSSGSSQPFTLVSGENDLSLDAGLVGADISITTTIRGQDSASDPVSTTMVGDAVSFTYQVFNTGNVSLANVVVLDDNGTPENSADDFTPTFSGGDSNGNGWLDLGEVWTYQASSSAALGLTTNTATASGTPIYPPGTVNPSFPAGTPVPNLLAPIDADSAFYVGEDPATPSIDVEKTTNGPSNINPIAPTYDNEDTIDGAGVPILTPSSTVSWTYQVTNTGNVTFAKADIELVDDNGTPLDSTDDLSVSNGQVNFLGVASGDGDDLLEEGEVWLYGANGIVQDLTPAGASDSSASDATQGASSGSLGVPTTFDFSGSSPWMDLTAIFVPTRLEPCRCGPAPSAGTNMRGPGRPLTWAVLVVGSA